MIVTGYTSMIGSRFLELTRHDHFGVDVINKSNNLLATNSELNLVSASLDEILRVFDGHENEVLVHFSAFTDVDGAELQRGDKNGSCWQLNVQATRKLVTAAKRLNLKLVYISTDFVFSGIAGPYSEDDERAESENSISWYGWTKLIGEKVIQESNVSYLIARTSYPYRANFSKKPDFIRNIIERLTNDSLYPVFTDQFLTPTFIDNFAKALDLLIRKNQIGIWHVVDHTTLTAFDIAREIASVFGFDEGKITRGSIVEFQEANPKLARRPAKGGLKNDKLRQFLHKGGVDMQDFRRALLEMKRQLEIKAA